MEQFHESNGSDGDWKAGVARKMPLEELHGRWKSGAKKRNLVYPSYLVGRGWEFREAARFFLKEKLNNILFPRIVKRIGSRMIFHLMMPSWAATAAAVLAVGTLVQSPRPKMFGNLENVRSDCRYEDSLVMLQGLLVDVKEASSIRQAGVGVERVRGAHWRGHVQEVIGHCHLSV